MIYCTLVYNDVRQVGAMMAVATAFSGICYLDSSFFLYRGFESGNGSLAGPSVVVFMNSSKKSMQHCEMLR